jgi:hypothetical protein
MFSWKQLLGGVILVFVIGIAGFAYRAGLEHPKELACTMEAKICPDGTAVGRGGPACEFSPCLPPNVEIKDAQIAFALPAGYTDGIQEPGADGYLEGMLNFYQKASLSSTTYHYITLYKFPIPEGQTANDVILANTRFQPSDMQAEDMSKFTPIIVNGKTFQTVVIERFEALVMSSYFLVRENDVLRFDVIEHDVMNWMEPNLVVADLPEHKALVQLLETLQTP